MCEWKRDITNSASENGVKPEPCSLDHNGYEHSYCKSIKNKSRAGLRCLQLHTCNYGSRAEMGSGAPQLQ